jgi:acetyl-CoA carboxylase biotin carboxyl carrier protein
MTLKQSDIETLVQLFGESDWKELHLRYGEDEIFLSKDASSTGPVSHAAAPQPAAPSSPPVAASAAGAAPGQGAKASAPDVDRSGWVEITAPNLGTFYRAPSPEADPYVTEGGTVTEDTEICLVEVMKLFTTIRAGMKGTVREICARDGDMVEYGATLMWIEPEA